MKIIYHCYGGAHSSVVAAAIHLNKLPKDSKPAPEEILSCAYFDEVPTEKHGLIHYLGRDENGHDVYNMGCGGGGKVIEKALPGILNIYGVSSEDLIMVDTLSCVNSLMRIGGFISRALKLTTIGRPIVVKGTIMAHPELLKMVEKVKSDLSY